MRKKVSVAMATYNGEKYIKEQLETILNQLHADDEIIISDDGSVDRTIDIINSFNDNRIKIIDGPKCGVKKNFENAIKNSKGEYIFLADQDDIWLPDKISVCLEELENGFLLVMHDAYIVNEYLEVDNESFFQYRGSKKGVIKNIIKNSYIGCCMAFNQKLVSTILPIPDDIEMHDQWIGILANYKEKVKLIEKRLIKYRRHSNNTSSFKHYPLMKMLKNRFNLIKEFIKRVVRK